MDWHCPFLADIFNDQVHEFHQRLFGRKSPFGLSDFTDLAVYAFNWIGGVNNLADYLVIFEKC